MVTHSNCGRALLPVNYNSSSCMLSLLCNSLFTILKIGTQTKPRADLVTKLRKHNRDKEMRAHFRSKTLS